MVINKIMGFLSKLIKRYSNFIIDSWLESEIKNHKKIIVIFWHPMCKPCQKIMFKIPFLYLKTKKNNITLKFCNITLYNWDLKWLWVFRVPTLIYFEWWKIYKKIDDEKEIFDYLKKEV